MFSAEGFCTELSFDFSEDFARAAHKAVCAQCPAPRPKLGMTSLEWEQICAELCLITGIDVPLIDVVERRVIPYGECIDARQLCRLLRKTFLGHVGHRWQRQEEKRSRPSPSRRCTFCQVGESVRVTLADGTVQTCEVVSHIPPVGVRLQWPPNMSLDVHVAYVSPLWGPQPV